MITDIIEGSSPMKPVNSTAKNWFIGFNMIDSLNLKHLNRIFDLEDANAF